MTVLDLKHQRWDANAAMRQPLANAHLALLAAARAAAACPRHAPAAAFDVPNAFRVESVGWWAR